MARSKQRRPCAACSRYVGTSRLHVQLELIAEVLNYGVKEIKFIGNDIEIVIRTPADEVGEGVNNYQTFLSQLK